MARNVTKIADLIDPEVMADMISAKLPNKIRVTPFAKVDNTLEGAEGDTITVPSFNYIGDAEDVAEGVECGTTKLTAGSRKAKVKKAMKAVELTDEAVLSGHGDPVGEATNQLGLSIASKVENDCIDALSDEDAEGRLKYDGSASEISYDGIVDALDVFEEEVNGEKAMFVHPKQVTTLRKDPDFISADKYNQQVVLRGEIGMIANTRIVPSRRVKSDSTGNSYLNPIIKLETDEETEDEASALTIYIKRNVNVETERDTLARKTIISVDEIYTTAVSNDSKVVLAKFKKNSNITTNPEITGLTITPTEGLKQGDSNVNADAVVATLSAQGGTSPFTYALEADETNGVDNASFKIDGANVKVNTTPLAQKDYKINVKVTDSKGKTFTNHATISVAAAE